MRGLGESAQVWPNVEVIGLELQVVRTTYMHATKYTVSASPDVLQATTGWSLGTNYLGLVNLRISEP